MIFERVLGVDHPDTVAAYVSDSKHFDMYCLASKIENHNFMQSHLINNLNHCYEICDHLSKNQPSSHLRFCLVNEL